MGDTLIQHNPFMGQKVHIINNEMVMTRVEDFVGVFSTTSAENAGMFASPTPQLPNVQVRRTSPTSKEVTCDGKTFQVTELPPIDKDSGTGGGCWLSTFVMLPWLMRSADTFKGKDVLEMGAGAGLNGIMMACEPLGVASITITDHVPSLISLIQGNVSANAGSLTITPEVNLLDWNDISETDIYDVIIASDCVFSSTRDLFSSALFKHLKPGGDLFMVNPPEPGRPGMDQMLYELQAHGDVELMPTNVIMNDTEPGGSNESHGHHKEVWMIHLSDYHPS